MSRMFNLIEALSSNRAVSIEQAEDFIYKLDMFRFDSNNIMNSVSYLMRCAADGETFKPSEEVFRDIGTLLSILSELNFLCGDQEGINRLFLENKSNKLEAVS